MNFKVSEEVSALGINVIFLSVTSIDNSFFTQALKNEIDDYYKIFSEKYTLNDFDNNHNIVGYKKLHNKVGVTDKLLTASPESIIKILLKHKSLRSINPIVDTYNYISIKNKISIGAHDLANIIGNVELRLTKGDEHFIPLGKDQSQTINSGEYCYLDENEVICRLDCRQCEKTKTSNKTKSCLFILQGNEAISTNLLHSTAQQLLDVITSNDSKSTQYSITQA
ncbi:MAG: phenylalanine--tRNA ligase beta subunit-related protein [Gammaproteobacteria bacterium]|nr:phenylalanine--tRNA ligase beta subunit-related protein [Gammaproteobacteria bacterium]